MSREPNRLSSETSLYLRQHMHNPVDWYPWGPEAFIRAHAEGKPIFLSIGYSACHWCHVMERESFEDEATAELLNTHFVSIKVDREERPDIDQIYMNVVQLLTGHGGWPLSIFIDPDGRPITGGTYFPPVRRYGMPSFKDVLETVATAWRDKAEAIGRDSDRILAGLRRMESVGDATQAPERALLDQLEATLAEHFDETHGGFGERPKFPNPSYLAGLLTVHHHTGSERALSMVDYTLDAMADGGIHDQLGGGFHRYSVDERWLVPHFEKMLYDNALLAPLYLEIHQLTDSPRAEAVARGIFDWMRREMTAPGAQGIYATQDADSEGEEGAFFVWTPDQIEAVLGAERAERIARLYGVTDEGNFEHGKSVLHLADDIADDEVEAIAEARAALFAAREQRERPATDTKRIAAWNGLAMRALARGAMILADDRLRDEAVAVARFVADVLYDEADGLRRVHAEGRTRIAGFLEDHACVAWGLLEVFRATSDDRWLELARTLATTMRSRFYDPERRAFLVTAADPLAADDERDEPDAAAASPGLVLRPVALYDAATPSAACVAISVLLQVAHLCDDDALRTCAEDAAERYLSIFAREPRACTSLAEALGLLLEPPRTVVVAGSGEAADELAREARRQAPPLTDVIELARLGDDTPVADSHRAGREPVDGAAAAYVCLGTQCAAPARTVEAMVDALFEG